MGNLALKCNHSRGVKVDEDTVSASSSGSIPRHYVLPICLHLDSYVDVGKALKKHSGNSAQSMVPRRIEVGGKFLNTLMDFPSPYHKRSLRRVLRRGCVEVHLLGASGTAPRRIYEEEMNFVLERLQHGMIETLHLENLSIQSANSRRSKGAEFLTNLKKLSHLQRIVIQQTRMEAELLDDVLAALAVLPRLREVTLNILDLEEDQVEAIEENLARLLQKSSTLESISLAEYPSSTSFWHAVELSPSLSSLSLPCQDVTKSCHLARIQNLLLKNTRLEQLHLRAIHPETKFTLLADGLRLNTHLQSLNLSLQDHHTATAIRRCMIPLLKDHNFTLTQLNIYREMQDQPNSRIACPIMDFYLKQNRHSELKPGRFYLLRQNPTGEEWTRHLIAAAKDTDVSSLYYWLRVQPNLLPVQS